jgi:methylmalonyl-CoA/ethylmalonyl-CoA epimerase
VPAEGVRTWFLDVGGGHLELLEPLGEDSPIAKHIEKRGEGLHHLCLRVDDLEAVLAQLAARGVEPVGGRVRAGAGGARVAFLHPRDTGGVLLELSETESVSAPAREEEQVQPPFRIGAPVVLNLRAPRERLFGLLRQLDAVGVAVEGLDPDSWDSWVGQRARGEDGPLRPSVEYFPLSRVDKLIADVDSPDLPSFSRRFRERTGRSLEAVLGRNPQGCEE